MDYAAFKAKLVQHGFVEHLEADSENAGHWSRMTVLGGQADRGTGKKPMIYIDADIVAGTATMSMASFPLKTPGMISIAREGVPFADMGKYLKNFEQGIIHAWREIAD